jgi:hypothetical protein
MTTPELTPELRNLIDARLDQIEQMLLRANVSYSERRHIVGDVESQIYEMMSRRSENPLQDDVQAVLDSLDPAEAYVPEELRGKVDESAAPSPPPKPRGPQVSKLAVVAAILAGSIAPLGLLATATSGPAQSGEARLVFLTFLCAASLLGVAAVIRIILSNGRLRGLPLALFATALFPVAVVNVAIIAALIASKGIIPWIVTGLGLAYLNIIAIRRAVRWLNQRRDHVAEALRQAFAGDKPEKNGIQPI